MVSTYGKTTRPRCRVCGRLARAKVLLLDANSVHVGHCHWTRSQRLVFPKLEALADEVEEPRLVVVAEDKYRKASVRLGGNRG